MMSSFQRTGFAAMKSRIWRIEAGSRHVVCPSAACTLVADGFTSIVDLAFGHDGTLYVVEFDAQGWLAVEIVSGGFPISPVAGGRVRACDVATGQCVVRASGLALPTAVTVGKDGTVWFADNESMVRNVLRDAETNLDFIAYSGAHGPSYGGDLEQRTQLLRVVEAFEELLERTPPLDCAVEYVAEREYGGGKWVVGCKDGRSFDVPDRRNRRATTQPERRVSRAR